MTTYMLINPSDDYEFDAPDDDIAETMCVLLSEMAGWERDDGDDRTVQGGFARLSPPDEVERITTLAKSVLADRRGELCEALRTLEIRRSQRLRLGYTDVDRWHDEHRTSVSDYRAHALALADRLDAQIEGAS